MADLIASRKWRTKTNTLEWRKKNKRIDLIPSFLDPAKSPETREPLQADLNKRLVFGKGNLNSSFRFTGLLHQKQWRF